MTAQTLTPNRELPDLQWPDDPADIPDWIYTDQRVYDLEQKRIFQGPTWNYVGLEAEIPKRGDYIRSYVGAVPVIVTRAKAGGNRDAPALDTGWQRSLQADRPRRHRCLA